jgi:hypothetical protein
MTKEELIQYIRENDEFYTFVEFGGHSLEQLITIKGEIEAKKKKARETSELEG